MNTLIREQLGRIFGVTDAETPEKAALASERRFVRGRSQLSPLSSGQRPKGHVITSFEALQAYGVDVLDEAVEYGSAILLKSPNAVGEALSHQREVLGVDYNDLSRNTRVPASDIMRIEAGVADDLPIQAIERIAFTLGIDEARVALCGTCVHASIAIGPNDNNIDISPNALLAFTEAASIIRTQHRLQRWLGVTGGARAIFPYSDKIRVSKAWRRRFLFHTESRRALEKTSIYLKQRKINTDLLLVNLIRFTECALGIPVVQVELPQRISGGTIAVPDGDIAMRGIVLNIIGENEDSVVRNATLLHEVQRIVFDQTERTDNVQIVERVSDSVMILRNIAAFVGIPLDDGMVKLSVSAIIQACAGLNAGNFDLDYVPIPNIEIHRSGRFSGLVMEAWKRNFIASSTAASYLDCSIDVLQAHADTIRKSTVGSLVASRLSHAAEHT